MSLDLEALAMNPNALGLQARAGKGYVTFDTNFLKRNFMFKKLRFTFFLQKICLEKLKKFTLIQFHCLESNSQINICTQLCFLQKS